MDLVNQWEKELAVLHKILQKTVLMEEIKWGASVFTYKGKNVVAYGGFKQFFTLWFHDGVFLADEDKVLINANEEKTKALRQWRFTHINQIDETKILAYVNEAIQNVIDGKTWKPQKTDKISLPIQLESELKVDKILFDAFSKLSNYKQNEYAEYIAEAKREETKLGRLEKIKPMILAGIGLNDKYKKK